MPVVRSTRESSDMAVLERALVMLEDGAAEPQVLDALSGFGRAKVPPAELWLSLSSTYSIGNVHHC